MACKEILTTGLRCWWPKRTVLCSFVYVKQSQNPIFQQIYQSEAGKHAELQMLKDRAFLSNLRTYGSPPKEVKEKNVKGLKDMHLAGIILETMTDEYWFDLFSWTVFGINPDHCRNRDNAMKTKLNTLKAVKAETAKDTASKAKEEK
ncbi:hypothetical protein OS493_016643 [Desmophyllum pertusum]|uniref:Uncharacterized protein n=1 Tax=Desmophyllum pertusum TaxID=174260 RepID=A0A9X0CXQ0_9CNID|nr:hypothetical protein OS493_016643 [Desmophyllum pertusum]